MIAFTGGRFQLLPVEDVHRAPAVMDGPAVSEGSAGGGYASAPQPEMVRDLLVRQPQLCFGRPVMNHQQPGAESLVRLVTAVADGALGKLREPGARVAEQEFLHCPAAGKLL